MPANVCPICELNDKVEKVSIIYMNGSHDTTLSVPLAEISTDSDGKAYSATRYEQARGHNETKLARALRPPSKPKEPAPPDIGSYLFRGFFFVGFGMMAVGGVTNSEIGALIGIIIGLGLILMMYSNAKKRFKKKMEDYYNSSVFQSWNQSLEKWNSLYFCHRDGQVFILGKQTSVPLERIAEIIN